MFPKKEFEKRFRDVLNEMDEALENAEMDEEELEQLSELNAETEDTLMLLNEISPDEEDAAEALEDVLDEFFALHEDYRRLSESVPEIEPQVQRLGMVIEMMKNNL